MTATMASHDVRSRHATHSLEALPHGGRDSIVLRVQCPRAHHVAVVYDTESGQIYAAPVRPRSHGARDLPDQPHGDHRPARWLDYLRVPDADDALPAWCDCGHRTLSRADILGWLLEGEHRVVVH